MKWMILYHRDTNSSKIIYKFNVILILKFNISLIFKIPSGFFTVLEN